MVHGVLAAQQLRQALDRRRGDAAEVRGAFRRELGHAGRIGLEALHVGRHELVVDQPLAHQHVAQRQRQRAVAAGSQLHQQVGALGRLGAARVDHHQRRAALLGALHVRHLVHVGLGRVLAPQHDQPRVLEVPGGVVAVLAQRQARGLEAGRPAQVAVGGGAAAEQAPEGQAGAVQQPLGAAARVVEDAPRALVAAGGLELARDALQGLVPGDRRERAVGAARQRVREAPRRVDPLDVGQALEARPLGRGTVGGQALHAQEPAVLDRDAQRAGRVAVARAGRDEVGQRVLRAKHSPFAGRAPGVELPAPGRRLKIGSGPGLTRLPK